MAARAHSPSVSYSDAHGGATLAACLSRGAQRLQALSENAQLEAQILLAHVLGHSRAYLYAHPQDHLHPRQINDFDAFVDRRLHGEPLPYLTGHIEFFGLDFAVDQRVLIPRADTETLVELALNFVHLLSPRPPRRTSRKRDTVRPVVVDVGTGSGCIAIALAVHAPHARIVAVDVSSDALAVARANAEHHGVTDRVDFLLSDLLTALSESVDLIVANPPYIATKEWPALPQDVGGYEPRLALNGGRDGLDVIRRLISQASDRLHPWGAALVEIGAAQGRAVHALARQAFPDADITIHKDLAHRNRVLGIRPRIHPETDPRRRQSRDRA